MKNFIFPQLHQTFINHNSSHPSFKTSFERIIFKILKNLQKSFYQRIFRLLYIGKITFTNRKKSRIIFFVKQSLCFRIIVDTSFYELFFVQNTFSFSVFRCENYAYGCFDSVKYLLKF